MKASVLCSRAALTTLVLALSIAGSPAQRGPSPTGATEATRAQAPPAEASPDDIDGPTMFATLCGFCHQDGGRAEGRGPKLAGTKRSDQYIVERIRNGKPGSMPAFGGAFSEGQIVAILAYIRALDDDGN
jgi:mono/diheme cytochrome c family protein